MTRRNLSQVTYVKIKIQDLIMLIKDFLSYKNSYFRLHYTIYFDNTFYIFLYIDFYIGFDI